MKFFVSGQIDDAASIRTIMDRIEEAGHSITHDWTASDGFMGNADKESNPAEASRRAQADMLGVIACDVYVLSSDNVRPGKGMYVELGGALALRETTGKPDIYITGTGNHTSIFYLHQDVVRLDTIDDVLARYSHESGGLKPDLLVPKITCKIDA